MAAKIFNITSIYTERDVFVDRDGKEYYWNRSEDMGLLLQARRHNINTRWGAALERSHANPGDLDAAEEILNCYREYATVYIADYPLERALELTEKEAVAIMDWWQENIADPTQPRETEQEPQ